MKSLLRCLSLLLAFFIALPLHAQLSNDILLLIPDSIQPNPKHKKNLTAWEKTKIVKSFDFNLPQQHIPVYDSIAASLEADLSFVKDNALKFSAYKGLCRFYNLTGAYQKSLHYTDAVLKMVANDTANIVAKYGHQRLKGALLSKLRRQEEAVAFTNEALANARLLKDTLGIGLLYYSLAAIYGNIQLPETSIKYLDSSLFYYDHHKGTSKEFKKAYSESVGQKFMQTFNLFEQHNDSSYLYPLRSIIASAEKKGITRPLFAIYPVIASFIRGEFKTTISLCDSFLNRNEKDIITNIYLNMLMQKYKALAQYRSGHITAGIALLEKTFTAIQNQPINDESTARLRLSFMNTTAGFLHTYYKNTNNFNKAYYYLTINKSTSDTLDIIANQGRVFETNQKYNFAKKEALMSVLERDNAIKRKELNFVILTTIILLLCFTIIGFILYTNYKNVKQKKKIADQAAQNEIDRLIISSELQIFELEEKNKTQKQEEQQRLAMELHDGLAGSIAQLKTNVELALLQVNEEPSKGILNKISNKISDVYNIARNKSHEWYHTTTEERESLFKKRVQKMLDNGFPDEKYRKELFIDDEALQNISLDTKIELIYIIQEALTNVIKHAGANAVQIFIYREPNHLIVQIIDNGKGMPADFNKKKGIDMHCMQHRLQSLGAHLEITPNTPYGTKVSATIPIVPTT